MANLNISGYGAFDTFVKFAQHRTSHGRAGDVAKATTEPGVLDNRQIVTVGSGSKTSSGWFSRSAGDKADNDYTRSIFKTAIANMFGGEAKIPPAVLKAMQMEDYGHGKPLTARRIMAVKAAIDETGIIAEQRKIAGQRTFDTLKPETKAALYALGYTKAELPNVARAVKAYAKAMNVTEEVALKEVTTPGSKANRLAFYGGRFLANSSNFKEGLRLLDSFDAWYTDVRAFGKAHLDNKGGDTLTKLNIASHVTSTDCRHGLEAMVFQHIAVDSTIDLTKSGEEVFGMGNNAATRFFGRNCHGSVLGTVINVPPEKRSVLFAAVDAFQPILRSDADLDAKNRLASTAWKIQMPQLFVTRCAAHLDELAALMDKGQLTTKNIIKICFPDIKNPGKCDIKALNKGISAIDAEIDAKLDETAASSAITKMLGTGCTVDELIKYYRDGTQLPKRSYVADWSMPLNHYDGGGFKQMKADLSRPLNYSPIENGEVNKDKPLVPADQVQNNIAFPDGTRLACSGKAEHKDNPEQVEAKIKALCGPAHGFQAEVVALCLSQSGKSPLQYALKTHGIYNAEHAVVDISLSKDDITGAVTVHYSSPASLPVRFSWSATVNVDGTCIATPMVTEKPVELNFGSAKEMLKAAADKFGFELSNSALAIGGTLLATHGNGMWPKNAQLLAQFIAKLPLDEAHIEECRAMVADTAKDLRTCGDFDFGEGGVKPVEDFFKRSHNAYIADTMSKDNEFGNEEDPVKGNIFRGMMSDINRSYFTINGQAFEKGENADIPAILGAFKQAIPSAKAQKAVSSIMHQGATSDLIMLMMKCPSAGGNGIPPTELHKLPGAGLIIQRDMNKDLYVKQLTHAQPNVSYKLDVSPDGNTAVLSIELKDDILTGSIDEEQFGGLVLTQKLTFDLRPEEPVVTDCKLSQQLIP